MILMRANPLLGPLEGVGPETSTFLGPNDTRFECCHFRAQKSLDSGSNLPLAFVMDSACIKIITSRTIETTSTLKITTLFLQPLEPEQERRTERDEETILGLKDGLEEFAGTTSFTVAVQQEEEDGEEESSLSFVVLQEDDTGQSSIVKDA
jgi:hypothetical protein